MLFTLDHYGIILAVVHLLQYIKGIGKSYNKPFLRADILGELRRIYTIRLGCRQYYTAQLLNSILKNANY